MNIWVNWNKVRVTCIYCKETMLAGSKTLYMQTWDKEARRKYNNHAHISCWLSSIEGFLFKHPYIPRTPIGKISLLARGMSPEQIKRRFKLINLRSALAIRRRSIMDSMPPDCDFKTNVKIQSRVSRIDNHLDRICSEMETLGGIPKGWSIRYTYINNM